MFSRYVLRTIEVERARRFYEEALGLALPEGAVAETSLEAWPLHERARAAGAPPHWLGHLEVGDLERAVSEMVASGAAALGPTVRTASGLAWATIRDPFGAVVALRARGDVPPDRPVAWHQLHTRDLEGAWTAYAKLTGWRDAGTIGDEPEGGHRLLAWSTDEPVGSVANTARWPGVHPHWLFYFPVDDVDAARDRVLAHGGNALAIRTFTDRRLAACEDPQGAAFGIIERR